MTLNPSFEDRLTEAIVRQFFENPPIFGTTPDGQVINIPTRSTPVQVVAARLLTEKNGALLDAVMKALDIDTLSDLVADQVYKELTTVIGPGYYGREREKVAQRALREQVDKRLAELLAQEEFAKMQAQREAALDSAASGSEGVDREPGR